METENQFDLQSILSFIEETPASPLFVTDEKDLSNLIDRIQDDLNKNDDWQKRIQALITVQALCNGNLDSIPNAVTILRKLLDPISTQLADLRSAVCKETCKTIALLSFKLKSNVGTLLEFWWPKIFRLVTIKIQVMAKAADSCIRAILFTCHEGRLLQLVAEGCSAKNATLRKLTLDYLCIICATWKKDLLEKTFTVLKSCISIGLADADASARKVARILFHLLMENPSFTKKMNQMKDELDQNVLKHLQLDGPANIDLSSLRNLSAALKASEQTIALLKQELITAIPYDASLGNEFELDDIMQFDDEPVKKVSSSRPKFPERRMSMSGAQRLMPGATLPSKDPSDSAESKLGKPSSLLSGSRRVSLMPGDSAFALEKPSATGIISESVEFKKSQDYVPLAVRDPARRTSLALGNGAKRILKPAVDVPPSEPVATHAKAELPSTSVSLPIPPVVQERPEPVKKVEVPVVVAPPAAVVTQSMSSGIVSVQSLQSMASDPQWTNRLKAFESMNDKLMKTKAAEDELQDKLAHAIAELSVEHANDTHQKVSLEAVKVLSTFTIHFPTVLCKRFDIVLPALFHRLVDTRPSVRDAANNVLNDVRANCHPEDILGSLYPKLLDIPDRTRTAALQYIGALLPSSKEYYLVPQNLHQALVKLALVLGCTSPKPSVTLTVSGKRVLQGIYTITPELSCRQIGLLSFQQQTVLKSLLSSAIPEFDAKFATASKSEIHSSSGSDKSKTARRIDSDNSLIPKLAAKKEQEPGVEILSSQEVKSSRPEGPISFTTKPVASEDKMDIKKLLKSDDVYFREHYTTILHLLFDELKQDCSEQIGQSILLIFKRMNFPVQSLPVLQYCSKLLQSINGMKIQSENSTRKLSIYTEILNKLMEHNNIAALSVMIDQLGPQSQVHGPRTADEDDAKYLLVLRSLSKVISMFSREQLQEYIAFLCRLGIMHVNSEEIQLRQASILLLSELYLPLKDSIFPYIELLSVTQRKLLMIYVEKKKGQSLSEHPQMRSAVDI